MHADACAAMVVNKHLHFKAVEDTNRQASVHGLSAVIVISKFHDMRDGWLCRQNNLVT
jgi:vancomycin permeability regulator SanA